MKRNPRKCEEMVDNFTKNPNFVLSPIVVESTMIQRVTSYKLLGVLMILSGALMLIIVTREHIRDFIL